MLRIYVWDRSDEDKRVESRLGPSEEEEEGQRATSAGGPDMRFENDLRLSLITRYFDANNGALTGSVGADPPVRRELMESSCGPCKKADVLSAMLGYSGI